MRILCSITLLVTALTQQGPLIHRHNATNEFGLTTANARTAGAPLQSRTLATLLLSQRNNPGTDANSRLAISIWYDLNVMCRGGNHSPEVDQACCLRNKIDTLLNNMGYCYHMGDIWKKCGPRDKRARNASLAACAQ